MSKYQNKNELLKDIMSAFFTPTQPTQDIRQELTIITIFDNKELNETIAISPYELQTQEDLANEANLRDDNMADYNPEDFGYTPLETKSGKVYYMESTQAEELKENLIKNKLLNK